MNWRIYASLIVLALGIVWLGFDSSNASEEEALRDNAKNYSDAVSKKDPEAMAAFWDEDAVYANPATGVHIEGRQALAEEFKKWFTDRKVDKLELHLTEVSFPEQNKALEKGYFRLTFEDNTPPIENAFSAVMVKDDNRWLFKQVRQIHLDQAPTNYEKLKELEWLVGKWIDTDEDVTIETTTQWDKYKNFLLQHFTMKLYNQDVLDGRLIIGWDPNKKEIRSWVFDSDGGFGEGSWYNKDNKWYVKTAYTLANGGKASAVHIYTKIDDNTYTWASEGRDVNGEILPNIKPIKVERAKE